MMDPVGLLLGTTKAIKLNFARWNRIMREIEGSLRSREKRRVFFSAAERRTKRRECGGKKKGGGGGV